MKMDAEDILRRHKLREPSGDLKVRIADATRGAWEKAGDGAVARFPADLWRAALGLAASIMIAVIGTSVNSLITAPVANHSVGISLESGTDMAQGLEITGLSRLRLVVSVRTPVDVAGFLIMRESLEKELGKGG